MIINEDTIARAQSGDEGAFVDLMRAHYGFVYAIVIGIVNNPQDAEEVVQDTFLNAYRGLPDLEDTKKFKNWLAKIARNRALNWQREQRIDTVSINEVGEHTLSPSDAPDEQLIHREQRELIRRAIETLSPSEREVARSYYIEGASYDELTKAHGLSYKAVSVRLSRAKQKLSKRLGHLLAGVFVFPASTLKKISLGGFTIMKVGTIPKITAVAVTIIILAYIGTRQFISSKEDASPSVEIVTSTESAQPAIQTDAIRSSAVTASPRDDKPQIAAEEMQQIEDSFAQLDEADALSETDTSQQLTDAAFDQDSDSGDAYPFVESEDSHLSAEEVMNAFVEAFKNLDFEEMTALMTGVAKDAWLDVQKNGPPQIEVTKITEEAFDDKGVPVPNAKEMTEEMIEEIRMQMKEQLLEPVLKVLSQAEIVNSGRVGDEFGFRLKIPEGNISTHISEILEEANRRSSPEVPEAGDISEIVSTESKDMIEISDIHVKMRKVDGVWRIYDME